MNRKWGFWFQNGTPRPYWNVFLKIVPNNQICKIIQHIDSVETVLCKIIQHIDSVETVLLKYRILKIFNSNIQEKISDFLKCETVLIQVWQRNYYDTSSANIPILKPRSSLYQCLLIGRHFSFTSRLRMVYLWRDFIIYLWRTAKCWPMLGTYILLTKQRVFAVLCTCCNTRSRISWFSWLRSSGSPRKYTVNAYYIWRCFLFCAFGG